MGELPLPRSVDVRYYVRCDERVCAEHGQQLRASYAADGGGSYGLSRRPVGDGPVAGRGAHGSDATRGIAWLSPLVPGIPRAVDPRLRPHRRVRAVGTATA